MKGIIGFIVTVVFFTVIVVVIGLSFLTVDLRDRLASLEYKVDALQELQQEKLNAFSKDVYNMTGVMELLREQAEILQEVERRAR